MKNPNRNSLFRRVCKSIGSSILGRTERNVTRHIRLALIAGLLLLVPLGLTYLLVKWLFNLIDSILQPLMQWIFVQYQIDIAFAGLGIIVGLILVYLAGLFVTFGVGRLVTVWGQGITTKIPLVGHIYSASRQLVESFSLSEAKDTGFKRVVLIEYPKSGAWSIGFLTNFTFLDNGSRLAVVYVPTAPLPNSGWVALVPDDQVLDTDLSVPQAMQVVFSAGVVSPTSIQTRPIRN